MTAKSALQRDLDRFFKIPGELLYKKLKILTLWFTKDYRNTLSKRLLNKQFI